MSQIREDGNAPDLRGIVPHLPMARVNLSFWSSPDDLAEHCQQVKQAACWYESPWDSDESFKGTPSMGAAIELCRNGWHGGIERVNRMRDKINARNPHGPRLVRYDVAGTTPNVPRAIAGNPMHMRRVDNARLRRKPVITLISDMSASWYVDAEAFVNRAACVAAIVDEVEAKGYACEVIAVGSNVGGGALHHVVGVRVKECNQPCELAKLAFALGHPSMYRRLSWVTMVETEFCRELTSGLGTPTALPRAGLAERGIYIIEAIGTSKDDLFNSETTALARGLPHLISELRKQDCPAFAETN